MSDQSLDKQTIYDTPAMVDAFTRLLESKEGIEDVILVNAHYSSEKRSCCSLGGLDIALKVLEDRTDDRILIIYCLADLEVVANDPRYKKLFEHQRVMFMKFPIDSEAFLPLLVKAKIKRRENKS